jgi:hypothetical protein
MLVVRSVLLQVVECSLLETSAASMGIYSK